jgi:hypothetical protein
LFLRIRTAKSHRITTLDSLKFLDQHTYLEVDNNEHNKNRCKQIRNVGCVLSPHRLLECLQLILLGQYKVEKSDDCTFKLRTLLCPDSDWRKALPKNQLTNIRSDEE